ncbi:hypothetical protein BSL78_17989 [Apostichopus japonicus]|uniref:MAM domain-containing protein n=1 Tax=Stichopus japonicus TaxID=307972 RepID=A0A2G8KB09_STIJA|nr:hypothetical protein BSL78_17989 [Apostichopus japonicus]
MASSTVQYRRTSFEIVMEAVRGGFEGTSVWTICTTTRPPPVECEFESDLRRSNVDDDTPGFDWQRGMNGDPSLGTGPPIDHSSESTTAYFAFANVANMPALSEARLASPSFDRAGVQCLNFFYNMYGDDIGTLLVYKQDEGDNFVSPSWEKSGDQGQYWRQSSVEVTPTTGRSFQIYFEAIAGSSQQGNMAIDDVTLLPGLCQPSDICTFEQNLCNWQNDYVNDDFDWIRDGAGTGSGGTGPQVDHTFNSKRGYYMYIEANGKAEGSKAWFVSDRIAPTAGRCFDFWYHMYGSQVETLNLYQQTVSSITPNLVWSKTGNYGDVWNNAKVPLTETEEFWVYFEGFIGYNATSDIALDDLYLQDVPCSTTPAPPTTTTLPATYPPDSHDCDFEVNLCYWNQDNTDDQNWTRFSGSTSSTGTGPSYDHTLGNSAGWYIYLESTSGLTNDKARLLSSTLSVDNGTQYCMEFWHHMYGPNIASLNIYTRQGADTLVWTKSGEQGDFWIQGFVNIPLSGLYQIIFEATRGSSYQGDIAVDDIRFYLGRCPPSALCDFESDECGYTRDPTSDFSWTRLKAGDAVTSLRKDHSYGTGLGHYMYADFAIQPANAKAAIVSPDFPATTGSCLNFYFAPVGDLDSGTLTVIRRAQSGAELEVWSSFVGRLHQWHLAQATVSSAQPGEKFNVVFEADRGNGVAVGGVAIDDIKINTGICPSSAADCDFETKGICGWQQVQEPVDDFDWTVISGSTTSTNTGPSKDHTLNSAQGHYAFIESSSPNLSGDFAQLLSPIFTGYQNRCLEFFYHMYGSDSGDLTVYRRVEDFSLETVFAETDNKGDVWRKGLATLSDGVSVYDLIIEATVGGFYGDIAIDDVRIFDGNCPEEVTSCGYYCGSGETCIEANQVCDFVADCPDLSDEDDCGYSCQFESNLCGWISEYTGAFRWIRGRGELPQDNTGPYIDHTTLSPLGYYMYVAPYSGSITWASLTGPTLHNTATGCEMQFWALISGVNVGFIEVTILDDYNSWSGLTMDTPTGDNVWEQQIVRIGRNRGSLQVIFRSSRSFAVQGAIAIDDILFNNCDLPVPGGSCQLSEFTCDNSVCIPNSQVCDYNDDCGDFSEEDEEDCLRCSFEDGMCEYSNIQDDDTDWTLASGVDTNPLPPFDHTLHRPGGSFVYVDNAPANANTARLAGPIFLRNPSGYCGMRLWFFSDGNSPGTLQFAYRTGTTGPDRVLAEIQGPVGNYWERYEVEFDSAYDFQAMIVAVQKSGSRSGVIAVDDITYTDGCVKSASGLPSDPPDGGTTISPCGSGRWRCGDGGCIDRSQVCDYAADCGDGSDEVNCGQCDFENDMCGYTDKSLGNHVWRRTALLARAPGDGYYLRVDTAQDPQSNFNVVLVNDDDVLDRVVVWYPTSNVFDWTLATVSFGRQTTDFYIHFEGSLYNQDENIYLDEISLVDCKAASYEPCELHCSNGLCVPETVRCDYSDDCADPEKTDEMTCDDFVERCNFEVDLCNWSQLQDDDMDWAWITGNAGKQGGAPGWDHTTITPEGSYLYLYSLAGDEFKTAHLGSVVFMPSQCQMRFWYHMYGPQVNRLSVLTKTSLTADYKVKWTRFESQADGWMRGDVIMDDISKFQVVIEAVAGISSATGDHIAIDDISFTRGCVLDPDNTLPVEVSPTPSDNCQAGFRGCRSDGSCITENKFCDFKFDCEDGTDEAMCPSVCNFDDSLCYWYQDTNDDINWQVHDSDTAVSIRAPDTDHTTNHIYGQYIFVDGNLATYNQHARLISPTYGQTGITCSLSFWYYQYDEEYGTLSVYLSTGSSGQDRLLAQVTREADNTDRWIRQDVILPVCITDFQIIIDAINQQVSPLPGGFAVDDVRFDTCDYEDVSPSCGAGLSRCSSGQCYPTLSRCDFSRDCCYDDSDESGCGNYERCNFEFDLCSWTNMVGSDEVDWSRRMAGASGGPDTDHTTDSGSGFYAIMGLSGTGTGDRAQLRSLAIDPVIDDCYLRLFVYLGGDTSALTVYIRTEVGGPLTYVWSSSLYELSTGTWIRSQVKLSSLQLFEVVIEATRGAEVEGIVALDDVSFTPDCPASASTLPNPTGETPTTRRQTQGPEVTTENKVTISTPTDNNKGFESSLFWGEFSEGCKLVVLQQIIYSIFSLSLSKFPSFSRIIAVSVIGGVLILLIILVSIAVFLQRRQDKKSDPGDLDRHPVYGDTQLSDEDKDGFTNAGFVSFGGEEEA